MTVAHCQFACSLHTTHKEILDWHFSYRAGYPNLKVYERWEYYLNKKDRIMKQMAFCGYKEFVQQILKM